MIDKIITKVLEVAKENPEGFTIDLNFKTPDCGYIVAYEETQDSHGVEDLKKVIEHAKAHDGYIGGWFDDNKYYFDSCKVFDLSERDLALSFGKENKQIAICKKEYNKIEIIYII